MEKKKFDVTTITFNALVAATYVVLTYASTPIAFRAIQFRIAEIMMLLPFFNKKYAIGEPYWMSVLTVGAGKLAVLTVGYIIFMLLRKNTFFFKSIKANQNLDFKC